MTPIPGRRIEQGARVGELIAVVSALAFALGGCGGGAPAPRVPEAAPSSAGVRPRSSGETPAGSGEMPTAQPCPATERASAGRCDDATSTAPAPAKDRSSTRLVRGVGDAADRLLELGEAALDREAYTLAKQYFADAQAALPEHPAPIVGLCLAELGLQQIPTEYAAAVDDARLAPIAEQLERALRLDPEYAPALLQRGRLLLIQGMPKQAESSLRQAASQAADSAEAHSALAVALLAQGKTDAALRGFERAAELDPSNVERLTNLGTAYFMEGRLARALESYRRALRLAPEDPRALSDLGTTLLAQGEPEKALPYLTQAQQLDPRRATFMNNLGYAHHQLGEMTRAKAWYERALVMDPKLGSAWINLGIWHADAGELEQAQQALEQALSLDPEDPRAIKNLQELKDLRAKSRVP
jgi:Tfp pilus assembly protein PilF